MLDNVKKGDFVVRKSHGKDIVFIVDKIIKNDIAMLTGIITRLKADAYIDDLEIVDKKELEKILRQINERIEQETSKSQIQKNSIFTRTNKIIYTGKILHLDGDRKYSEKSNMYYKKMGLKAVVKNIPEYRQVSVANSLIDRYKPDILVVTRT